MARKSGTWRNRIVRTGEQAADQFLAHPDNWRTHSLEQESALLGVLEKVGWVRDVLVSERTGYVLDGHLRVRAALGKGDATPVPFSTVDVTEDEEALILSTLDPLAGMAGRDEQVLGRLLADLPEDMAALAAAVHADRPVPVPDEPATAPHEAATELVVECASERQRDTLAKRLQAEGFTVRLRG